MADKKSSTTDEKPLSVFAMMDKLEAIAEKIQSR
jgi:hypothetical protein